MNPFISELDEITDMLDASTIRIYPLNMKRATAGALTSIIMGEHLYF